VELRREGNCPENPNVFVAVVNDFSIDYAKDHPCLWFDDSAEEAVKFYTSLFQNSKFSISHYGEAGSSVAGRPKGSVMTITFHFHGQEFMALNGGPHLKTGFC
jgi:predicted 3-demethylubiquinone-9 3-methyltransferase (glyoxalase superfamily)